jgi:hypothetical protein
VELGRKEALVFGPGTRHEKKVGFIAEGLWKIHSRSKV